jgi:hypothetical protein
MPGIDCPISLVIVSLWTRWRTGAGQNSWPANFQQQSYTVLIRIMKYGNWDVLTNTPLRRKNLLVLTVMEISSLWHYHKLLFCAAHALCVIFLINTFFSANWQLSPLYWSINILIESTSHLRVCIIMFSINVLDNFNNIDAPTWGIVQLRFPTFQDVQLLFL